VAKPTAQAPVGDGVGSFTATNDTRTGRPVRRP
jgi:hypothetical protein